MAGQVNGDGAEESSEQQWVPRTVDVPSLRTMLDRSREENRLRDQRRRSITSLTSILGDSVATSLLGGNSVATSILSNSVFGDSVATRSYASRTGRRRSDASSTTEKRDPPSPPRRAGRSDGGGGYGRVFTRDGSYVSRGAGRGESSSTKQTLEPSPSDASHASRKGERGGTAPRKKKADPPSSTLRVRKKTSGNGHTSISRSPGSVPTTSVRKNSGISEIANPTKSTNSNGSAFTSEKAYSFLPSGSPGSISATRVRKSKGDSGRARTSKSITSKGGASTTEKACSFSPCGFPGSASAAQVRTNNGVSGHARISKRTSDSGISATGKTCSSSPNGSPAVHYRAGDTRIHRAHSVSFDSPTQASALLTQLPLKHPLFVRRSNQKFTYAILVGRIDRGGDGGMSLVVALDEGGKLKKVVERRKWGTCLRLVNSRMVYYEHH